VPVALKEKLQKELNHMETMDVIVRQTEPTEWVNSFVTIVMPPKTYGYAWTHRTHRAVKREHYPLCTI
jgi:hypothetical protein